MGKPTTTLEWIEYDGTDDALPDLDKPVLLFAKDIDEDELAHFAVVTLCDDEEKEEDEEEEEEDGPEGQGPRFWVLDFTAETPDGSWIGRKGVREPLPGDRWAYLPKKP
jgi:hypothetical protein